MYIRCLLVIFLYSHNTRDNVDKQIQIIIHIFVLLLILHISKLIKPNIKTKFNLNIRDIMGISFVQILTSGWGSLYNTIQTLPVQSSQTHNNLTPNMTN